MKSHRTSYYVLVVERKLARFYPWILAGLVILYIVTFPLLRAPMWAAVPVAVAGWFYYEKAGLVAGILTFFLNLFLINLYIYDITWERITLLGTGILAGHLFVIILGVAFGYLRAKLENLHENNQRSNSRERTLVLVNMIVRDLLECRDINEGYYQLLTHIVNLFVADYAYLVHWNESPHQAVVLSSTLPDKSRLNTLLNISETDIIMTMMESNQVLFIEDAQTSRLVLDSPIFQKHLPVIQSALALPLTTRGYRFGAVILGFDSRRSMVPDELAYFQLTGVQISLALRSVLQEQRIEKQLKEAQALNAIGHALSESETIGLDAVLQIIVDSAMEIIPHITHAVLHILDHDRQLLIPRAVAGNFEGRKSHLNMHMGQGVAGQVISEGRTITIQDIRKDDRFINSTIPVTFRSMAVAPVILNQKRIGTISVLGSEIESFSSDDVNLLASLGTFSAIAIENAALYETMKQELNVRIKLQDALMNSIDSERQLRLSAEAIAGASVALVSTLDEDAVLNEVLAQVERLLPGYTYAIYIVEENQSLHLKAHRGLEKHGHVFQDVGILSVQSLPVQGEVIRTKKTVVVQDTLQESRSVALPSYGWIRSYMCIPLLWKDQLLGLLNINHEEPNMLTEESAAGLKTLVNVAAVSIANAQLLENTQQSLKEISSLYDISRGLVVLDFNELLVTTVEMLHKNFGYYHVQVYLEDQETGDLILKAASGVSEQALQAGKSCLPAGVGIVGHVYDTSTPFFTNNVDEVHFFVRDPFLPDTQSELAVPLKIGGSSFGVLDIQQSPPRKLTSRDLQLINTVAEQLSASLYNARLYENLQLALNQEKTMRSQLMQSERLATVGRLLASISHELNNPLQAIQNVLFLLKQDPQLSEQGRDDLEVILSETERMTSLIGRLRTTYRTPLTQDFVDIQLNLVVEDVYALTATYMRHKNIAFEFLPGGSDAVVTGVPDQIRQVLLNLFMNSIDAMPAGGKLTVSMQCLHHEEKVYLTVLDTGTGIAPDILPNIFEPFTTDKETGTGLGMTIARDIILHHHGEIQAQNNPQGGAMFKIWLPARKRD